MRCEPWPGDAVDALGVVYLASVYGWRKRGGRCHWQQVGEAAQGRRLAIITAWNPGSMPTSAWQNRRRQGALRAALRKHQKIFWPAWGGLGIWWEEALALPDISCPEACDWAVRFRQNAFLWLDGRRTWLVFVGQSGAGRRHHAPRSTRS
ncbi:DUF3293 domain-containing protein [Acidithiobacillus sulfuriphilus]|uniref:DUF3293 domain-containing protein n=1 Tax=Acidithiobacillus sulfuriphilus TaxID=1867749 RepID=A0ACD5HSN6_9PROT|nr:DUF3293 domain-containing protein [Acidithiobacillus sulfuriphilus]